MKMIFLPLLFNLIAATSAYTKGFSIFGLETPLRNVDCSWSHDAS